MKKTAFLKKAEAAKAIQQRTQEEETRNKQIKEKEVVW